MNIGILPDAEQSVFWPAIHALLEPAAERGGVPVLEEHELVWLVSNGYPVAAATTRVTTGGFAEVILVGGRDWPDWLADLSNLICAWARDEGMRSVRAYGRKGWARVLPRMGWNVMGEDDGFTGYERLLDG